VNVRSPWSGVSCRTSCARRCDYGSKVSLLLLVTALHSSTAKQLLMLLLRHTLATLLDN
jgi:hypothetical protein